MPMASDEMSAYYARKGLTTVDGFDRQRILDSIRESRRRSAREDGDQALNEITDYIRAEFTRELGHSPTLIDALLHVAYMLGAYVAHGLTAENTLNVIARLADDLDKDQPASGVPAQGWDIAEIVAGQGDLDWCGCGEPITEYDGVWVHVFNPALTGADDHDAHP